MKDEERQGEKRMEEGGQPEPKRYPREVITTHTNADFDALASMIAASKLYPGAALVFSGSQENNLRNFFLHSMSYLFNFVKLRQIAFDEVRRLIVVDTRQRSRIGRLAELADRPDVEVHIYDHHPDSGEDLHGQVEVIEKTGSNTAILTAILRERGIGIGPDEATVMCLGIHEDTGSFTFSSTTPKDYRAAAWLLEQGADLNSISDLLTRELTAEQVWLLNDLTRSATSETIHGVKIVFTKVVREEYFGDFAALVHKFMEMENLDIVFALAQMEDKVYLVARSRNDAVNAAELALALGGGGHPQAASATIKNKTMIQVEKALHALLKARIRPTKTAGDMMSSPVFHILPQDTVKAAADHMTRYNINVLLVMEASERLLGFVTRQVVEKAVYLGKGEIPVFECMTSDFTIVTPETPLKEVQELIIRKRLRILPVLDGGRVCGVITRTDLLNILLGEPLIPEFFYNSKNAKHLLRMKNLASILKERLPKRVLVLLREIGRTADELGYNAYLVGGLVRDVLMRRENLDVDIVIEGNGIHFAHVFSERHGGRVRDHKKFETAVIVLEDGFKVDVATARVEFYRRPGGYPVVTTSSLKLDLYRRDFTINTLAIKINERDYGTLLDYFGGQEDIREKVLRVLHNLSFVEDPSRVLRAIRFEQRFGLKMGKMTLSLLKSAMKMHCLKDISGRRLFQELRLICEEKEPVRAIERMDELEVLAEISPGLSMDEAQRGLLEEARRVIAWYHLLYFDEPFEPWKVYWHTLTSRMEGKELKDFWEWMGMSRVSEKRLLLQREAGARLPDLLYRFEGSNFDLYKLLEPYDTETLLFFMARAGSAKAKRLISVFFTRLKRVCIATTGEDLLAMGITKGPIFREILDGLFEARLNGKVTSKEEEIQTVRERWLRRKVIM